MARPPRVDIVGLPQHLIVRGNNRCDLFIDEQDRHVFLRYLQDAVIDTESRVHAYVLMSNHVHLLATGSRPAGLSRMVQGIGRRFAKYANRRQSRTGTLFEGRFRSSLIQTERYFLTCMRYIELNPVRAGITLHPRHFPWSSYRQNASGDPRGLLSAHDEYLRLGVESEDRGAAYCALFDEAIGPEMLAQIRSCVAANDLLGGLDFQRWVKAQAA